MAGEQGDIRMAFQGAEQGNHNRFASSIGGVD
jgi:hypothetical protein